MSNVIKTKEEYETEFVDYILSVGGVDKHAECDEGRHTYHMFWLNNGTIRYWRNMSESNLVRLGLMDAEQQGVE